MMRNTEGTSRALWDWVQANDQAEFKDVHALAFHVHGPGVFHMVNKPIKTLADFKGLKLRAPTRQTNKMLAAFGATPVGMPVPQLPEALSKGVIDGGVIPWEVVPASEGAGIGQVPQRNRSVGAGDLHLGVHPRHEQGEIRQPAARREESARCQQRRGPFRMDRLEVRGSRRDRAGNWRWRGATPSIPYPRPRSRNWKKAAQPVIDDWVKDVTAKGANGKALLDSARSLIDKYKKM